MIQATITATGLYRPDHIVSNAELVQSFNAYADLQNAKYADEIAAGTRQALVHSNVEFIEKASGIKQRYVIDKSGVTDPTRMYPRIAKRADDELSVMAEMAVKAAEQALARAGRKGSDVDMVLCSSANMQRAYPAMAIEIQDALGAGGYGFDMLVGCSAATFAIDQALGAIATGRAKCVLMVNPEITSPHVEWRDRDCHFIFGDICTAMVIEAKDSAVSTEQWDIVDTMLATQFSNNIRNNFGFMSSAEDRDLDERDQRFRQEGRKVFKEVVPMAAAHIDKQISKHGLAPTDIKRYWLHQANVGMNQLVIEKLVGDQAEVGAGHSIAPVILGEFANTASAGSIVAFDLHRSDLQSGDMGLICSFGAGYSIGSVLVRKV